MYLQSCMLNNQQNIQYKQNKCSHNINIYLLMNQQMNLMVYNYPHNLLYQYLNIWLSCMNNNQYSMVHYKQYNQYDKVHIILNHQDIILKHIQKHNEYYLYQDKILYYKMYKHLYHKQHMQHYISYKHEDYYHHLYIDQLDKLHLYIRHDLNLYKSLISNYNMYQHHCYKLHIQYHIQYRDQLVMLSEQKYHLDIELNIENPS